MLIFKYFIKKKCTCQINQCHAIKFGIFLFIFEQKAYHFKFFEIDYRTSHPQCLTNLPDHYEAHLLSIFFFIVLTRHPRFTLLKGISINCIGNWETELET